MQYGILLSLILGASATPLSRSRPTSEKRDATYPITGIQNANGIQPRLEIRQLAADPTMFNLYLLAMTEFQQLDQETLLSYYQIAGIHGWPVVPWDGVAATTNSYAGYCTHNSNLFGPWHRPYLALYEMQINEIAMSIASEFGTAEYENAALNLRIPYWDWAMNPPNSGPVLATQLSDVTAQVTYPNGTSAIVPNPLYSFSFHPLQPSDFPASPYNQWPGTLRWPSSTDISATSSDSSVEGTFEGNLRSFRSQLMTLYGNYQSYNLFTNTGSGNSNFGNIESIHNTVHVLIGGTQNNANGHMSVVPISAFDPIFFMHHAQVDRLILLWQGLYPDTYVDPYAQAGSTYTIASGSTQDVNSPLEPFHSDTVGTFWTSAEVRNSTVFGYTIPELQNNPDNDTLKQTITDLYLPPASTTFSRRDTTANTLERNYIIRFSLPSADFTSSYSVSVFLGPITATSPAIWYQDPSFIASPSQLVSPTSGNATSTQLVHLNTALEAAYAAGDLNGLDELSVVQYLGQWLDWKVVRQGQVLDGDAGVLGIVSSVTGVQEQGGFTRWFGGFRQYPWIGQAGVSQALNVLAELASAVTVPF